MKKLLEIAKPILFSTEMVQAILDGRKIMTRRVVKFPEGMTGRLCKSGARDYLFYPSGIKNARYKVGDVLWVRETWADCATIDSWLDGEILYIYKADFQDGKVDWKWKPSIHMPKTAARIFLRVTDVRAERLRDISIKEMIKEGVKVDDITTTQGVIEYRAVNRFEELWNSVIEKKDLDKYGFDANPWVFAYEFERIGGL